MSDSGRQIGDCKHAKNPAWCVECLREAVVELTASKAKSDRAAECAMQMELEQTIADEISLDEVSIDEAWLRSIGFSENANGVLCLNLGYLILVWIHLESVMISGSTKHYKTRGDIRQLLNALGVEKEKAK